MNTRRVLPIASFALAAIILLIPTYVRAQAWTPEKGELALSLDYQYVNGGHHLFSDSVERGIDYGSTSVDLGTVESQVLFMNAEIGVTDRLALEGGVAFIGARYLGSNPHGPPGAPLKIDNGQWYNSFQDGRIGVRFMALKSPAWVLTPSVSYGFPTTDYPVLGHASLGRHLKELRMGVDVGRVLSLGDEPNAYFQGSYSYAVMEDTEHVSLDRSDLFFEFGYFLPKSVTVQGFADYQNVHGGVDWAADLPISVEHEHDLHLILNHDVTAATHFWRIGGGASVPLAESVELYGSVAKTVWGINTHDAIVVTVGVSWSFQVFGGFGRIGN